MNIVEMILKLLNSGDTLSKIASMLGMGQEQAGKAVSAAVPNLLAGWPEAASKPGGGAKLANVLAKQDQACSTTSPAYSQGVVVLRPPKVP